MRSHHIYDSEIPSLGVGTRVWWSHQPTGCAVVFVHGFGGQALGTWSSFPSLLMQEPKMAGWDLFFFGYDGLHTEAISSAADLGQFLDLCSKSPSDLYSLSTSSPYTTRVHPATYTKIVLVAHSLGAVVCRRAMVDAFNRATPASWANQVHLFTFAPAHNGAKILALVFETLGALAAFVSFVQLFNRYIVLKDLEQQSLTLNTLHADLRRTFDGGKANNLRALDVVFARNDRVVVNLGLYPDPAPSPNGVLKAQSHTSVCKPHSTFVDPVTLLTARL